MPNAPRLPRSTWSAEVHQHLVDLLATPHPAAGPHVAVFDLDDTLLCGDFGVAAMQALEADGQEGFLDQYEAILAAEGRRVAYPWAAFGLAGFSPAEANRWCTALTQRVFEDPTNPTGPRPAMLDLVDAMHLAGWEVWVCSASVRDAVVAAAAYFSIPADRVLAMTLRIGEDGLYQRELVGPATLLEGKAEAVQAHIDRAPSLVAGDSRSDREMMLLSRHGLFIEHGNPDAVAYAESRGWWVQRNWSSSHPETLPLAADSGAP